MIVGRQYLSADYISSCFAVARQSKLNRREIMQFAGAGGAQGQARRVGSMNAGGIHLTSAVRIAV